MTERAMTFEEAMTRARAAHVVVKEFRQPGNDYALEFRCKCGGGMFGSIFAANWDAHVLAAADQLLQQARTTLSSAEAEQADREKVASD